MENISIKLFNFILASHTSPKYQPSKMSRPQENSRPKNRQQPGTMSQLLVFEFPSTGPFGAEAEAAYKDLATDISQQPGLIWKVWIEDPQRQVAGGVYLFTDTASAEAYTTMHTARLNSFGITNITATSAKVNEGLSLIDHAQL